VKGCDAVVLARASMAGAADLCNPPTVPVLSSPRSGLESALAGLVHNPGWDGFPRRGGRMGNVMDRTKRK